MTHDDVLSFIDDVMECNPDYTADQYIPDWNVFLFRDSDNNLIVEDEEQMFSLYLEPDVSAVDVKEAIDWERS